MFDRLVNIYSAPTEPWTAGTEAIKHLLCCSLNRAAGRGFSVSSLGNSPQCRRALGALEKNRGGANR